MLLKRAKMMNIVVNNITMATGATIEIQFRFPGLNLRKNKELETTETELSAIARPASSGFNTKPMPANILAAMGMPITL